MTKTMTPRKALKMIQKANLGHLVMSSGSSWIEVADDSAMQAVDAVIVWPRAIRTGYGSWIIMREPANGTTELISQNID